MSLIDVVMIVVVIVMVTAYDGSFMFYNKPNGMAHFLKNADPPVSEAVVALIDPDMILMSPLSPNVGERYEGRRERRWSYRRSVEGHADG